MAGSRASHWPSEQDLDLFHKVVADVTPLRPEPPRAKSKPQTKPGKAADAKASATNKHGPTPATGSGEKSGLNKLFPAALAEHGAGKTPGLDKRSAQRLMRGKIEIEGRIDLHGMTQAEARPALTGFVNKAHHLNRRYLLVITGKGRHATDDRSQDRDGYWVDHGRNEPGVLRRMVPRWLREAPLSGFVLAYSPAQPKDGGSGALYVLLKRRRNQ